MNSDFCIKPLFSQSEHTPLKDTVLLRYITELLEKWPTHDISLSNFQLPSQHFISALKSLLSAGLAMHSVLHSLNLPLWCFSNPDSIPKAQIKHSHTSTTFGFVVTSQLLLPFTARLPKLSHNYILVLFSIYLYFFFSFPWFLVTILELARVTAHYHCFIHVYPGIGTPCWFLVLQDDVLMVNQLSILANALHNKCILANAKARIQCSLLTVSTVTKNFPS